MRYLHQPALILGPLLISTSLAQDVEFVTDLDAYSLLAPCAADAISSIVAEQTQYNTCDGGVTELQSCICSNTALAKNVTSSIEDKVKSSCGGNGDSDDQMSASRVIAKYCDPKLKVEFPTPTTNIVNAYITDIGAIENLPPCASSALESAVMTMPESRCPTGAVSLYAPCVCSKDVVVEDISFYISLSVGEKCSNDADVTSAFKLYTNYCNMNKGKTSFEMPKNPPGDMTYHITGLPEFSSLNSCVRSQVSTVILQQTTHKCPSGPQALASCICIKAGVYSRVSSTLTSEVKLNCESSSLSQDISSALKVFEYYCSAAKGEVSTKVSESIEQTYADAVPIRTGTGSGSGSGSGSLPEETGNGGGGGGDEDGGGGGGGASRTATIAASVLGAAVAVALIVSLVLFIRRRRRKARQQESPAGPPERMDQSELHGGDSLQKTSPVPIMSLHPDPTTEMPSTSPYPAELQSHLGGDRDLAQHSASELAGGGQETTEGQRREMLLPQLQNGIGWQAGPVETYEIDSTLRRH